MICTTFAQRTGNQPGRARVGSCGVRIARPVGVDAAAAVGDRLVGGAYRSWQAPALGLPVAADTHTIFTMSTKRHSRTLGTRTT